MTSYRNEPLFSSRSRFNLMLIFVALMLLRVMIGFHFFKEGTSKFKSGFTAEYFLKDAKGPLAPYFQRLIRDNDGRERLCIAEKKTESGETRYAFDTETTLLLWEDFKDQATLYYGFGSEELEDDIQFRRENLAKEIADARAASDKSVNTANLEQLRRDGEASVLKIRSQIDDADEIYENHRDQLLDWLQGNQTEIISHFGTADRLQGFERDGENREQVATYVESLRGQVKEIKDDRRKQLAGWSSEIESIWDSYEAQINGLATDKQAELTPVSLHRPFDQPNSNLKLIDRIIPWFDTIVGVLLILGLFTRFASLMGAGFLASVIATQPPWIPGTVPTYYQAIELFALLVIFATCAGRMGGLDYFFSVRKNENSIPSNET